MLEVATTDAFSLENSIPRVRALIAIALASAKLLETGELEERLAALLESAVVSGGRAADDADEDDDL